MLGACTNPDGSVNAPATLAIGAGALIAGLAIASASDDRPRHRGYRSHPTATASPPMDATTATGMGMATARPDYRRW
jgi:hypothetical protein